MKILSLEYFTFIIIFIFFIFYLIAVILKAKTCLNF